MLLHKHIEEFLLTLETDGRSANTRRGYAADLRGFAAYCGDAEPTRALVRRYLALEHTKGARPSTLRRKLYGMRAFFAWAVQRRKMRVDPTDELRAVKQAHRVPHVPAEEQMAAILELAEAAVRSAGTEKQRHEARRDRAILELLYAAGLRQEELVTLDLKDVLWDDKLVRVTGKGQIERHAPFGEPAEAALRAYLESRALLVERLKLKTDALFLSRLGLRICGRQVQRLVNDAGAAIGMPTLHPHLLRHACGSHMHGRGADLRILQKMLGHAKLGTTQVYVHASQGRTFDAYQRAHPRARREGATDS